MRKLFFAGIVLTLVAAVTLRADTVSKRIEWSSEKWIPVGLISEGVVIDQVRFEVQGGINWNPLRAGIGPQAFISLKNDGKDAKVAVAIALFDASGGLIAAGEVGFPGTFEAGDTDELKITFRDVKRRFFEAKTAQIAIETWR